MPETDLYHASHPVRIVSAAALFDGHDAAINIMRRILQASGCEVIHLGHNRSADEIVTAAIQEDAQGVAITSYQGGHMEYFTYIRQLLAERGADHVRIYGGGGGVIVPSEIEELHRRGIDRIFSPDDGRQLGLQGMINEVVRGCDFDLLTLPQPGPEGWLGLAREITRAEIAAATAGTTHGSSATEQAQPGDLSSAPTPSISKLRLPPTVTPVIGLTGTGGAGKSSLTDELVRRFVSDFPDKRCAVLSVDPTRRKTGGALLGDRIRFNTLKNPRVYMRSMATRESGAELSRSIREAIAVCQRFGFNLIFVETAGIGQGDSAVAGIADVSLYVMTAEYGAPSQLEKIEMLDYADFVVINKFERRGSADALRDVRKQYARNNKLFAQDPASLPVFGTIAAQFNDAGVNTLYAHLIARVNEKCQCDLQSQYTPAPERATDIHQQIIPPGRERYLSEISDSVRDYHRWAREQRTIANDLDALQRAIELLGGAANETWVQYAVGATGRSPVIDTGKAGDLPVAPTPPSGKGETNLAPTAPSPAIADLMAEYNTLLTRLHPACLQLLQNYDAWERNYQGEQFSYSVRGKTITVDNYRTTLSGEQVRKVTRPAYHGAGNRLYWRLLETSPASSLTPPACFPSSASSRSRRGCSPARARQNALTAASTCWPPASPARGCPPPSTALPFTARTPTCGLTSTARSARAA
jgi:isobutyryl-CoA mutase